jgi:hypothetical protein
MPHLCTMECQQKRDLVGVASDLAVTSNALSISVQSEAEEIIDARYAAFLAAKEKFVAALRAYREHLSDNIASNIESLAQAVSRV